MIEAADASPPCAWDEVKPGGLGRMDTDVEEIKAALAALADEAGATFSNGELHWFAWYLVCADNPDRTGSVRLSVGGMQPLKRA